MVAQSCCFHFRKNRAGLQAHAWHWCNALASGSVPVSTWFLRGLVFSLSEGNVQGKFCVTPRLLVESCSEAISPACYICGNSTQKRCRNTVSPQWDVIEWKQMVSWRKFQGRITFSSYCLFDFTVIVWWIVSDLILQIEKLLLAVLPNAQIK